MSGSATYGYLIDDGGNGSLANVNLPNISWRVNNAGFTTYASNVVLKTIDNYVAGIYKISNARFTATSAISNVIKSGSRLSNVKFSGALTLNEADVALVSCDTASLTISAIQCTVDKGSHTTIAVNADKTTLQNCNTSGVTVANNYCTIQGGVHTGAIVLNGSYNVVEHTLQATSISINAASTNNRVAFCNCDTPIVAVANNTTVFNSEY